jgi:hypothetical protein
LICRKLNKVELDFAIAHDDAAHHQFGDAAFFFQAHLRPAGTQVDGLGDHLFT